jgi:hypothetical protein
MNIERFIGENHTLPNSARQANRQQQEFPADGLWIPYPDS